MGPVRGLAGDGHHAEQGLGQQILAGLLDIGAVGAVAGGGGIDQAGLARLQRLVAEAQLLHHAGAEILRHHVGGIDQAQRELAALGRLEVDGDAALVAVGAQVQRALAVVPDVAAAQWRCQAPSAFSTAMTSAPRSPSAWMPIGPSRKWLKLTTRMPFSRSSMRASAFSCAWRSFSIRPPEHAAGLDFGDVARPREGLRRGLSRSRSRPISAKKASSPPGMNKARKVKGSGPGLIHLCRRL